MINKIKIFVKSSKLFYSFYFYLGSFFIRLLALFIKPSKNNIIFVSYGGKKYDDSPKVVYEYLKKSNNNYNMIWAFINPEDYPQISSFEKVKIDTLKYYYKLLKSSYWISNSSLQRGLNFKTKKHKNILFMHGLTALKKSSKDLNSNGKQFKMIIPEKFDKVFIEGTREKEIVLNNINVEKNNIYNYGLPRCDELLNFSKSLQIQVEIKTKLNIDVNKKIILYAPTYREYKKDKFGNIITSPVIDYDKWKSNLSENFVVLITSHYEIGNKFDILYDNSFIIDVSKYNSINELIAISDIIISDYSNIIFDSTIIERPILCYAYDYEEYKKFGRGFYNNLEDIFYDGIITEENELIEKIKNIDYKKEIEHSKKICHEYILNYGDATEKCVKEIFR